MPDRHIPITSWQEATYEGTRTQYASNPRTRQQKRQEFNHSLEPMHDYIDWYRSPSVCRS